MARRKDDPVIFGRIEDDAGNVYMACGETFQEVRARNMDQWNKPRPKSPDPAKTTNYRNPALLASESVNLKIAAEYLDVQPQQVSRLVRQGELDAVGPPRHRFILTASLRTRLAPETPAKK